MNFAKVATNLLDLWLEPRYNSERASQLLFNEPLKIGESKSGFCQVQQSDGYTGWADERFLAASTPADFESYDKTCNFIVHKAQAVILSPNNQPLKPHFLYYGTKLKGKKTAQGIVTTTPDGENARLKPQNLMPINRKQTVNGQLVLKEAKKWLGVPYLWGGMTPAGFDCSGFLRQVFARFNIYLPRDTKDQINAGREVARNSIKIGDLVFFKRHVGLAVSAGVIIHCSVGGGGVRIESIEKGLDNYRADLDRDFATVRRII